MRLINIVKNILVNSSEILVYQDIMQLLESILFFNDYSEVSL